MCAAINHGEKPLKMKTKSAFVYFRETQSGDVTATTATSGIAASVRKSKENRAYAALAQQAVDKSKTNAACRCCCPKTNWRVNS